MLSTTHAGREFRKTVTENNFAYHVGYNELLRISDGSTFGHTTADGIYVRNGLARDKGLLLDKRTQRFVPITLENWAENEMPDTRRKFTVDILAPGLIDERVQEAFAENQVAQATDAERKEAAEALRLKFASNIWPDKPSACALQ